MSENGFTTRHFLTHTPGEPMRTQCTAEQLEFAGVGPRHVVATFDGGTVSSDAGALLLGKADRAIGRCLGIDHLREIAEDVEYLPTRSCDRLVK